MMRQLMHVELIDVRYSRFEEIAAAQGPVLLVQLEDGTPGIADLVPGIVKGTRFPNCLVEKCRPWIVRISIVVEDIGNRELADRDRDPRDVKVLRTRKLDGTMPLASPECTPSVKTSTRRLPTIEPRSEVVIQS